MPFFSHTIQQGHYGMAPFSILVQAPKLRVGPQICRGQAQRCVKSTDIGICSVLFAALKMRAPAVPAPCSESRKLLAVQCGEPDHMLLIYRWYTGKVR